MAKKNFTQPKEVTEQPAPKPVRASGKVTVGLKLPAGLLLRVFRMEDFSEPVMGGGVKVSKRAVQVGEIVKLNGFAAPQGESPKALVVNGYAITSGVDAEVMAKWMDQNSTSDIVTKNLIKVHENPERVTDETKEHVKLLSGLERLNTRRILKDGQMVSVDPRIPNRVQPDDAQKVA